VQASVDRGQLRLLRIPQSRIQDVLPVERRDVLVPEARDRHMKDVLRQNVKRLRRPSARRFAVFDLPPRETHRIDPAETGVPALGVPNPFRTIIAARTEERIAGTEPGSPRSDGQSSSPRRPLTRHHEPSSQPVPDSMFLRRRLPRQSVRPEGAHESGFRDRRP